MAVDSNGGSLELNAFIADQDVWRKSKLDAHGFTSRGTNDTVLVCSDSMSMKEADWPHAKVTLAPSGLIFRDSLGNPTGYVPNDFNGSSGGSCWNCNDSTVWLVDTTNFVGIGTTMPNSPLHVRGPIATAYRSTGNVGLTLGAGHSVIKANPTMPFSITVTLPTAVWIPGRQYTIKRTGTGGVTVAASGGETIDGAATYSLSAQWKYVVVVSDGANWLIVGNN